MVAVLESSNGADKLNVETKAPWCASVPFVWVIGIQLFGPK